MADIQVARPETGAQVRVAAEPGASFVLDFPVEDMGGGVRDGSNLVLNLNGGGNVVFENFYDTFNADEKPEFVADGAIIESKDFFANYLQDASLDPAAGPAAGPTVANGGRYRDYTNSALATGIDHLERLDYNSDRGFEWDDAGWITRPDYDGYLLGAGGAGVPGAIPPAAPVNHPVSIVPGKPWTPDPNIPEVPGDPNDPHNPDGPNMDVNTPRSAVRVHEKNIGTPDAIQEESFIINAPDGVGSIKIGNTVVWVNGSLVPEANRTFPTDEGKLTITGFDPATGKLTYTFELTSSTDEHSKPGEDAISHSFKVTVTDTDGDTASSYITVIIEDDIPDAIDDSASVNEGETVEGSVLTNDDHGQDGPGRFGEDGPAVKWEKPDNAESFERVTPEDGGKPYIEVVIPEGTAKLYDDGSYEFTANNVEENTQVSFDYSIIDSDGDEDKATLTIDIVNNTPTITTPEPKPDPDDPTPPDNPDDPDNPTPPDPDNPDDPTPPDNPDDPSLENKPSGAPGHIIVDEGDLASGSGAHGEHGVSGTGIIEVNLNGDSKGTIQVGKATLNIEGGKLVGFEPAEAATVNGVTVTVTGAELVDGKWQVSYDYALNGAQEHEDPYKNGAADILGGKIDITVTDASGDQATGQLTVEVHDDAPVVTVRDNSNTVTINMGADNKVMDDDGTEAKAEVFMDGSTEAMVWTGSDGAYSGTDVYLMADGTYISGNIVLVKNGDDYHFKYNDTPPENGELPDVKLNIVAIDSDGDQARQSVTLTVPTITPEVPTIPVDPDDPEDPGKPVDPDAEGGQIIVDEAALATGSHQGDVAHGASGTGVIIVNLKGDTEGEIKVGDATLNIEGGVLKDFVETEAATVDGVKVVVTGAVYNKETGKWEVSYKYELTENQTHADPENPGDNPNITNTTITGGEIPVTVTDATGDVATGKLTVEVHDDVPVVTVEKQTVTVNMGADKGGADKVEVLLDGQALKWSNADVSDVTDVNDLPAGDYESGNILLTKNEDGSYSFKFMEGADADVKLKVEATDSDGDHDGKDVTLTVPTLTTPVPDPDPHPVPPDPENPDEPKTETSTPSGGDGKIVVDEAALATGSHQGDVEHGASGTGVIIVNLKGDTEGEIKVGNATLNIEGGMLKDFVETEAATVDGVKVVVTGAVYNKETGKWDVSYKYELTENQTHADPENPGDNPNITNTTITGGEIPVTVTDATGDVATGKLTVEVHDDVPVVTVEKQTVTVNMGADKGGADKVEVYEENDPDFPLGWLPAGYEPEAGEVVKPITDVNDLPAGEYESGNILLTKNEDGSYSFKFKEEADADVKLKVEATDSDGDHDGKDVTLTVPTITPEVPTIPVDPDDPEDPGKPVDPDAEGGQIIVDEAALATGSHQGDTAHGASGTGVIIVNLKGDTEGEIKVGDATLNIEGGVLKDFVETEAATVDGVKVVVTGAVYNKETGMWEVSYKYELTENQTHADPENPGDNPNITNTTITGGEIPVTVTDATGDVATGKLTVEVHDDVPVLKVLEQDSLVGKLELSFGADGKLESGNYLTATIGEETVQAVESDGKYTFTFGNGDVLTLAPGEGSQFDYAFTPAQGTDLTMEKLDIALKATDGDHDVAKGDIAVELNQAPTLSIPPTQGKDQNQTPDPNDPSHAPYDGNATIVVDEGALANGSGQHTTHGASGEGSILINVHGEPGGQIDLAFGEQKSTIQLPKLAEGETSLKLENPVTINVNGLSVTFDELTLVKGSPTAPVEWQLSYDYKYDPDARHEHGPDHDRVDHDVDNVGAITVTVTDGIGGQQASGQITIEIHDDVPMLNLGEVTGGESSGAVQNTLNFVTNTTVSASNNGFLASNLGDAKWDHMTQSGNGAQKMEVMGDKNGVQMISSSVQYYYSKVDGEWYLDRVEDRHGDDDKQKNDGFTNNTANIGGRQPFQMSPDGLSIKYDWDKTDGENGIGTKLPETSSNGQFGTNMGMSHASEAVVFENMNNVPTYGMNIEFGKFEPGERAVITFYLTPTANNDDSVVFTQIVNFDDLTQTEDGKGYYINIAVPDGFTKAIVSALPGGDNYDQTSDFTIRQVEFSRPSYTYEGEVSYAAGQDGVVEGSLKWDWSAIKTALESGSVEITNTIGAGSYKVEVEWTGTTVKATIPGKAAAGSLAGQVLFEGELKADGAWHVTQFYNFKLNGKDPVFDFKFSITDNDGDVITADQKLDMGQHVIKDRFDSAQDGLWSSGSSDTNKHHEYDFLTGKQDANGQEANDLMYGREGNDVMFGDGGKAALDHLNDVLGTNVTLRDISNQTTNTSHANNGTTNKTGFETLQNKLIAAAKYGTLAGKLEELEKLQGDGGDDALFGGAGADILIGGGGDDYLFGNGKENTDKDYGVATDRDILLGGAGNDIIVYGKNDYIIDGGSGIDFLLAGKDDPRLAAMDKTIGDGVNDNNPYVDNIEVLITALHTKDVTQLGITSLKSLANYGVKLVGEGASQTIELSADWVADGTDAKGNQVYTYKNGDVSLRLETSLKPTHNQLVLKDNSAGIIHNANGGAGSDVLFGYNVAEVAGLLTVLGLQSGASQEAIAAAIKANPEAVADYLADHGAGTGAYSNSIGGAGDDYLFGQNANDGLMGDANAKDGIYHEIGEGINSVGNALEALDNAYKEDHDALVKFGENLESRVEAEHDTPQDGNDMLFGGGGEDVLYGGGGNDVLIGGSGDDYLDGGQGSDYLYGGSGNDIIVFDKADYVIDGGSGIDILIGGLDAKEESLDALLNNNGEGPVVNNIEVFIKGIDPTTMGLTNMDKLASELGIKIEDNKLHLDDSWKKLDEQCKDGIDVYGKGDMILETSLVQVEGTDNLVLQQATAAVENGNA